MVRVPVACSFSPITKTNWEGTGAEADVKVSADQALDVARRLAAEEISKIRERGGRAVRLIERAGR